MTARIQPLADVQPEPRPSAYAPPADTARRIDGRVAQLREALGLRHLGVSLTVVPPGRQAYPFHGHRHNDELFLILDGSGALRTADGHRPVRAGDLVACPSGGPESAHALVNTGDTELRYLAISSQHTPEVCDYPDSGKVGVFDSHGDAFWYLITRESQQADYWDGE